MITFEAITGPVSAIKIICVSCRYSMVGRYAANGPWDTYRGGRYALLHLVFCCNSRHPSHMSASPEAHHVLATEVLQQNGLALLPIGKIHLQNMQQRAQIILLSCMSLPVNSLPFSMVACIIYHRVVCHACQVLTTIIVRGPAGDLNMECRFNTRFTS